MKRIQPFYVYARPSKHHKHTGLDSYVFIPNHWSLAAALFNVFWCVYHRLWFCAWLILVAIALIALPAHYGMFYNEQTVNALQLLFQIWVGFNARQWYQAALVARGYDYRDVVMARTKEEAKYQFLKKYYA